MQRNNPKNTGLNKALIFVSAFVVSSLIIYQVYYYSKIKSLSSGIIATAAELPGTKLSPILPKHFSDTSYMGNAGLLAAIGDTTQSSFAFAPTENYLSGNGVFNKAFLDEMNIGISNKFPNHPPIGFNNLQQGDKILFSYLFKNVILPLGFSPFEGSINVNGKHFRALLYMGGKDSGVKVNVTGNKVNKVFIPLDNGNQELVISKTNIATESQDSSKHFIHNLPLTQNIVFPEIDFNIIKYWKAEEAEFIPNAKDYKHLEERVKLKLSTRTDKGELSKTQAELKPPFYIYLYKTGSAKPYFGLYIANTELMLPAKGN
ncbi:MAG: hypothetical protein ACXWDO_11900 [Bacteroidia bacterium]